MTIAWWGDEKIISEEYLLRTFKGAFEKRILHEICSFLLSDYVIAWPNFWDRNFALRALFLYLVVQNRIYKISKKYRTVYLTQE